MRARIRQPGIVEGAASAGAGGVAKAAQPFLLLGADRTWLRAIASRREPLHHALQLAGHAGDAVGFCDREVSLLTRIVRQVVQLPPAVLEELQELPVASADGAGRRGAPAPTTAAPPADP